MRTRKLSGLLVIAVVALLGTFIGLRRAHAQTISVPFSYSVGTATHASCPAVQVGITQYCYPSDGPYVSILGAAWQPIPLTAAAAGVTSFNGRTGAVVPVPSDYPDAVTSVNGKTGAVVLSATTTLQ